jgi:hypothetical protein
MVMLLNAVMSLKVESDAVLVSEVVCFFVVGDGVFFNILRSLGFSSADCPHAVAVRRPASVPILETVTLPSFHDF